MAKVTRPGGGRSFDVPDDDSQLLAYYRGQRYRFGDDEPVAAEPEPEAEPEPVPPVPAVEPVAEPTVEPEAVSLDLDQPAG